jgi:Mg2+-importing ATPase
MNHLPRLSRPPWHAKPAEKSIHFSPILEEVSRLDKDAVFERMKSSPQGLTDTEAAARVATTGPNIVAAGDRRGWPWRLLRSVRNPLVILLTALATVSFATGDARAGTVMALMVVLGVMLRLVQETRADSAAAKLKAMIKVTTAVVRGAKEEEIPLQGLVPGDVVTLSAGDMIPADVRLVAAKDLFVSQGPLTGESLPVEKLATPEARPEISPLEFTNICYLGTSVESGAATAVVVATGAQRSSTGVWGSEWMDGSLLGICDKPTR